MKTQTEIKEVETRIGISIRMPTRDKPYYTYHLERFCELFNPELIKSIDFGKQDIRGTESITLIDHQSCVPYQKHFENKWEMLGFVVGYVNGATDSDYDLKAYKKEAEE